MGPNRFADVVFWACLGWVGFVALTTGGLVISLVMVGLGAYAVWRYVWIPAKQRQIQPLLNQAQAARDVGNVKAAVALYEKALVLQPKNLELYYECGAVKFGEKDFAGALADFNKATSLNSGYVLAHLMASLCHCNLKNYRKALAINNEIINAAPNGPKAFAGYLGRGSVFIHLRKFDHALGDFQQAYRLNPSFGLTSCSLAEAFCYIGEFEKALEAAERAIDQIPSLSVSFLWRGWSKFGLTRYEEALKDCDAFLQRDPQFGKGYEIRGRVHQAMGHLELALTDLERALELCRQDGLAQFEADVMQPLAAVRQALGQDSMAIE
jgi:tetratricopeptide (TPR) repeat protein